MKRRYTSESHPFGDTRCGYERQGSGYDAGAVGFERVGRDAKPRQVSDELPLEGL